MNRQKFSILLLAASLVAPLAAQGIYTPAPENVKARQEFSDSRFGIFLHWGIYSTFAQGEWYLNEGHLNRFEYAKAASAFYPSHFDATAWIKAIKDSGAKYITITSRHHDGFSMFNTQQSDYNIVKATPFHRDILKELADACHAEGISLHIYYSHLDWMRDDYPIGRTGHYTGRTGPSNWPSYYKFMNNQLTELLTNYGPVGAIWFDGWWDHDSDKTPFNWQLAEQYALIHRLQPACLIGNNHHQTPNPGEDIQIFERDLPGENKAGLSGQSIGRLPLETCETMNGMWGYKVADQNYKTADQLIQLLVRTAGKGANLLLNIGPQPNGELPASALERLKQMGQWLSRYGETIYGTTAGDIANSDWGATTRKGKDLYVHILKADNTTLTLPLGPGLKVRSAVRFDDKSLLPFRQHKQTLTLTLPHIPAGPDFICTLKLK
jgi:alpha-L-fucosidase